MQVESHAVATITILVVFLLLTVGRKAGQEQLGWKWRREMVMRVKGCVGAAAEPAWGGNVAQDRGCPVWLQDIFLRLMDTS